MTSSSLQTVQLQAWARRIQEGDRSAVDELLNAAGHRLEALARKMLRAYPSVRCFEQTDDVLQNALIRLWNALRVVQPTTVRDFFGLAAEQMRRELLDMARHHYGPRRHGPRAAAHDNGLRATDAADRTDDPADVERWAAFHEGVAGLPAEEREVVGLIFYHNWTHAAVAELFQVNERTVRRRWVSAMAKLHALRGAGPSS